MHCIQDFRVEMRWAIQYDYPSGKDIYHNVSEFLLLFQNSEVVVMNKTFLLNNSNVVHVRWIFFVLEIYSFTFLFIRWNNTFFAIFGLNLLIELTLEPMGMKLAVKNMFWTSALSRNVKVTYRYPLERLNLSNSSKISLSFETVFNATEPKILKNNERNISLPSAAHNAYILQEL